MEEYLSSGRNDLRHVQQDNRSLYSVTPIHSQALLSLGIYTSVTRRRLLQLLGCQVKVVDLAQNGHGCHRTEPRQLTAPQQALRAVS